MQPLISQGSGYPSSVPQNFPKNLFRLMIR